MEDSRVKSVSDLLASFFDQDVAKRGETYSGFSRSWKTIAGSRLGEHSRPADIRHGILIIETEHQGWMQLLQFEQSRLLDEIKRKFPDLGITGVAFRLSNASSAPLDRAGAGGAGGAGGANSANSAGLAGGSGSAGQPDRADEGPLEAIEEAARSGAGAEALPPELAAKFAKIRKNIKKRDAPGD
jgi:hypothetical protein